MGATPLGSYHGGGGCQRCSRLQLLLMLVEYASPPPHTHTHPLPPPPPGLVSSSASSSASQRFSVCVMRNLADLISLVALLPGLQGGGGGEEEGEERGEEEEEGRPRVFSLFTSDSVIILRRALFLIAAPSRRLPCQRFSSPFIDTCFKKCALIWEFLKAACAAAARRSRRHSPEVD